LNALHVNLDQSLYHHVLFVSRNTQSSYYADQPGWSFSAFAMIGIVMTPLGDGLVIPGLSAFKPLNLGTSGVI
jgi:hypothetical protein